MHTGAVECANTTAQWIPLAGDGDESAQSDGCSWTAVALSMQWSRRQATGPYSSLLLSTITDIRVGDQCDFIDKLRHNNSKDSTTRRLLGRAAGGGGGGGGVRSGGDGDDVDVSCCVSFVGLKRRLDVVFEERMEVDVWLWVCQRAKAATGVS